MSILLTERLRLRPMEPRDRDAFVAMNLDPEVMHFFAERYTAEKSDEHIARYQIQLARDGFSFLTLEHRKTGQYLGLVGMQIMTIVIPNLPQPAVEIGWRLTREAHGQGYATEAAQALLNHGFCTLRLPGVVAIIATGNTASQRVAHKLGMVLEPELTFHHPIFPKGHRNATHFVYSLKNPSLGEP